MSKLTEEWSAAKIYVFQSISRTTLISSRFSLYSFPFLHFPILFNNNWNLLLRCFDNFRFRRSLRGFFTIKEWASHTFYCILAIKVSFPMFSMQCCYTWFSYPVASSSSLHLPQNACAALAFPSDDTQSECYLSNHLGFSFFQKIFIVKVLSYQRVDIHL